MKCTGSTDELGLQSWNNPKDYGAPVRPNNIDYAKSEVPAELKAEAIRANRTDPNTFKTPGR